MSDDIIFQCLLYFSVWIVSFKASGRRRMGWRIGGPVVGITCLTAVVQPLGPVTGAKYRKIQTKDQEVQTSQILKVLEGEGHQKMVLVWQPACGHHKLTIRHTWVSLYPNSFL